MFIGKDSPLGANPCLNKITRLLIPSTFCLDQLIRVSGLTDEAPLVSQNPCYIVLILQRFLTETHKDF